MSNFKTALKEQFSCTKSKIKMHDFQNFVFASKFDKGLYTTRELCAKCHQPRS